MKGRCARIAAVLLASIVSLSAFAQAHVLPSAPKAGPINGTRLACTNGPPPQIAAANANGMYVHLSWLPVPGARYYSVARLEQQQAVGGSFTVGGVISPPLFSGLVDGPGSSNLGFWDAVPDLGRIYVYKVSAIQANNCTGTTMTGTLGPLWPAQAGAISGIRTTPTTGNLVWTGAFGALGYRISGNGISNPWVELKAGMYSEGLPPALAAAGMTYNNGLFTYALSSVPANDTVYSIVALYPNGVASSATTINMPVVNCHVTGVNPSSGLTGSLVSIKGDHFDSVMQVDFGNQKGQAGESSAVPLAETESSLTIPVPTMRHAPLPQPFYLTVRSEWGSCTSAVPFTVTLPPPVTVPNLMTTTTSLQAASQILQQAGLLMGSVTAGSNLPTAIVQTQDRQPGAKVPRNTAVNVSTVSGATTTGFKGIQLTNSLAIGAVYIWLYDYSTGQYSSLSDGNSLAMNAQTSISLPGHFVMLYAVAPQMPQCGGRNDPSDPGNCAAWQSAFLGGANGATVSVSMH
jgi:hypothetical protein